MKAGLVLPSLLLIATTACHRQSHIQGSRSASNSSPRKMLSTRQACTRMKHGLPALGIGMIHEGQIVGTRHGR